MPTPFGNVSPTPKVLCPVADKYKWRTRIEGKFESSGRPTVQLQKTTTDTEANAQERRKGRVTSILAEGLPALPHYIFELNALLNNPSIDLKTVSKIIRTDPSLSAQILGLANSALFNLRRRVMNVPEAVILLGSERLRTLVLSCAIMKFAGRQLSAEVVQSFWQHSFLTAMLSERIARWVEYPEVEQAYMGGLLHDIGRLPLLIVACEEEAAGRSAPAGDWQDDRVLESEYFGVDHCEVGRWMGISWKFFPSLIDVLEHHHDPSKAHQDPLLTGIVGASDHYCRTRSTTAAGETDVGRSPAGGDADAFLRVFLPKLWDEDRAALSEFLAGQDLDAVAFPQFSPADSRRNR